MSKISNQIRKEELAIALADGGTVSDWAAADDARLPTAYAWSASPEVVDQVDAIRRAALEQAVNRFSKNATAAYDQIVRLVTEAGSESVRLQAARAFLSELMRVCNYAALGRRLDEIESRIADAQLQPEERRAPHGAP